MMVLKPSCHLKSWKCLAEAGYTGQKLAQGHPCIFWGQSPDLPTHEPVLHCMSRKPGMDKPGGEGSFCVAYPGENTEPSPRVLHLQTSQEGYLSSLALANTCMHTHTHVCRHTCMHRHCSPRLVLPLAKREFGILYGERQQQPREKDKQEQTKFPCTAPSVARAQMAPSAVSSFVNSVSHPFEPH